MRFLLVAGPSSRLSSLGGLSCWPWSAKLSTSKKQEGGAQAGRGNLEKLRMKRTLVNLIKCCCADGHQQHTAVLQMVYAGCRNATLRVSSFVKRLYLPAMRRQRSLLPRAKVSAGLTGGRRGAAGGRCGRDFGGHGQHQHRHGALGQHPGRHALVKQLA